jgi:hypothetical protein
MKRLVIFLGVIALMVVAMPGETSAQSPTKKNVLDIYYTHSTNRCAGCKAIETQTKETLEKEFSKEVSDGKIVFHAVNIDLKENKAFVDKYEVWGSGLFIINNTTAKNTDLTKEGFATARTKPEEFRATLAKAIRENLKQ